ncbi:response regulator transcription factor [Sinorhizobium numidicum]|uniref:Response regulator transcription factor n=1 Tax=Sinorhizobium numidicum TaxID=680248 RepID=A0ABY8CW70_9HYPH|nr:response regulator transcription factor [Sinorhizobium numidicum]WEX74989.1 response regulator transcription factor [Sinorhizobium numidicum]WEX80983.1 response regulator transcription factor [Sinorhizobium numidicum]
MELLNGHDYEDAGCTRRAGAEPRRTILIVTDIGTVSERLIHAIEREFPWIVVEQVEQISAACNAFSHPVALILVDAALIKENEDEAAELLRMHPHAHTAAIEPQNRGLPARLATVLESPLARSVLPMNLRLDVWLAVIRLMLCGGEYLPPGLFLDARRNGRASTLPFGTGAMTGPIHNNEANIAELTARELQILERVSRGLQNKLIAAEFRLSENTVKIHLHHIIRKLGAHNRTEAAARFRSFQERVSHR